MRTLKTEEMELVAGGAPGDTGGNSQSTKNNGLGNFNQAAPGQSAEHNGAENDTSDGESPSGFPVVPGGPV